MIFKLQPLPKDRTIKIKIKFAWLPVKSKDRELIWLEKYIIKYIYEYKYWDKIGIWSLRSSGGKKVYLELLRK